MFRVTRSEEETRRLGARFGKRARPGDLVLLKGVLGSGKTTFVQGFARGAGYKGKTASPTFGLARLYRAGKVNLHHLDLYRVAARELGNLGLEDYLDDPQGICVIEWPEAAAQSLTPDRLEIAFAHRPDGRALTLKAMGPRSRRLLGAL